MFSLGHTKPFCALVAKIVRLRRVTVTFFTDTTTREKVQDEIARQFAATDGTDMEQLIR